MQNTEFPDQDEVKGHYEQLAEIAGKAWLFLEEYVPMTKTWRGLDKAPEWEPWNIYRLIDIPDPEPCKLCNIGRGCDGSCY